MSPGRACAACRCSLAGRSPHRCHCPGPVGLTVAPLCLFSRFMPPDDPLGRRGPTLSNFLSRKQKPPEPSWQHCPYGGWRPAPQGPSAGPCVCMAASRQGSCEDERTPGTLLHESLCRGRMQGSHAGQSQVQRAGKPCALLSQCLHLAPGTLRPILLHDRPTPMPLWTLVNAIH